MKKQEVLIKGTVSPDQVVDMIVSHEQETKGNLGYLACIFLIGSSSVGKTFMSFLIADNVREAQDEFRRDLLVARISLDDFSTVDQRKCISDSGKLIGCLSDAEGNKAIIHVIEGRSDNLREVIDNVNESFDYDLFLPIIVESDYYIHSTSSRLKYEEMKDSNVAGSWLQYWKRQGELSEHSSQSYLLKERPFYASMTPKGEAYVLLNKASTKIVEGRHTH